MIVLHDFEGLLRTACPHMNSSLMLICYNPVKPSVCVMVLLYSFMF